MQDLFENHMRSLKLVEDQEKDPDLWAKTETKREEMLQMALRLLHATVEGDDDMVRQLQNTMAQGSGHGAGRTKHFE